MKLSRGYHTCSISYSTKNQPFAERLSTDLQAHGVRCWFAPHDIQGGRKILEQIDQAIRLHERLLLILSPESLNSEWVKSETTKALRDSLNICFSRCDTLCPGAARKSSPGRLRPCCKLSSYSLA